MTPKSQLYLEITELFRRNEFEGGRKRLESAGSDLSEAERLECIGNCCFYQHDQQAAVDQFETLIRRFPEHYVARYHYILGLKLEVAGKLDEAFHRYRTAIEAEPTFVDAYIELGALLYKQGDSIRSARCFEHALEFDPEDLRIYANLRAVYRELALSDPSHYKQRYEQLEQDYPKLEAKLRPIPEGYQW